MGCRATHIWFSMKSLTIAEETDHSGAGPWVQPVRIGSVPILAVGDLAGGLALGFLAALMASAIYMRLDPRMLVFPDGNDVWFEGDLPTVFRNLTDRWSDQSRNANHPLFPLLTTLPVYLLRAVGVPRAAAVGALIAAVAAIWTMLLYATLRASGLRKLDAAVFTFAGISTSAAIFWLPVPESAALASTSILLVLLCAAWSERGHLRPGAEVTAAAAALSVTVTHWMAGLLLLFIRHPLRRSTQMAANAFVIVVLLWAVQRAIVPSADFFIGYAGNRRFILQEESGGPTRVLAALIAHGAVMPRIDVRIEPKWGPVMTVQHSLVGSGGAMAILATSAWLGLLALGAAGLRRAPRTLRLVTLGTLGGQIALYAVYGEETFLYTLAVMPLLVVIAASSVRTSMRPLALILAGVFIVSATWTNTRRLSDALRFLEAHRPVQAPDPTH
jgi:hypothetical protein